ncbi:MAG TPA: hypothetical protein VFL46_11980 [Phycicoccus sp.]|nr:hypothetical protein [Phycicoccus sp.]
METTITFAELDTEAVALLPSKETLFWNHYNWAGISATNTSMAINAGSHFSHATSGAWQAIQVYQG